MTTVRPQPLAEGRFQLLEVIGEGGMATVYRAFDSRLQRPRAIKILSPAFAQRPALRRRFLAEAQTMANLEETRVVRVFDMGEDGDRVFIVMELIEGGSLVDRVRLHGPLPPRMAAKVVLQLCESLQKAHEANVIHRDIKPHNVLLTQTGDIRITDFGIAQVQADDKAGMTRTGAVLGTWGFMAPEQKTNAKQVDARADIYSCGGTLWSLIKNDTPPELFMTESEPEWFEGIPEPLAEVIKRSTRYRREERYPSARAMADALAAVLPLLPDDPDDTPPLIVKQAERQGSGEVLDTLAQLENGDPSLFPAARPAEGTMVPDGSNGTMVYGPGSGAEEPFAEPGVETPSVARRLLPIVGISVAVAVAALVVWAVQPDPGPGPSLPMPPSNPAAAVAPPALPTAVEPTAPAAPVVAAPVETPVAAPPVAAPAPSPAPAERPAPATTAKVEPAPSAPVLTAPASPLPEAGPSETKATAAPVGKLSSNAPGSATIGESVAVSANISGRYTLKLYYRGKGAGAFREKAMSGSGGSFSGSIKIDESMAGGVEYFVAATDPGGATVRDGSAMKPKLITVQ